MRRTHGKGDGWMAHRDWLGAAGFFVLLLLLLSGVVAGPGEETAPLPPLPQEVFFRPLAVVCPDDAEAPQRKCAPCTKADRALPPPEEKPAASPVSADSNGRTLSGTGYVRWVYTLFRQSDAAG